MPEKPLKKSAEKVKAPLPECIICYHPTINSRVYCERCRPHIMSRKIDKMKRRRALIAALDRLSNLFLCQISHQPVELVDRSSHKWIQFDHITPIKTSEFQVLWAVFNEMKGRLTDNEFRNLVKMLRDRWLGTPFDRSKAKFEYWNRTKPKLTLALRATGPIEDLPFGETPTDNCCICGDTSHPKSIYCPRCRRFFRSERENVARRMAMQAAWDPVRRKFICFYTGVELDEDDMSNPWLISFDRAIPEKKGDLVVAALWITLMKVDLGRDEFYPVVNELAGCFEAGKVFDKGVCEFKYWERKANGTRKLKLFPLV
jgi:ribosomal protein L44E